MLKKQNVELKGKFSKDLPQKTRRSRFIAVLLAFLLGDIGIHKFYLGQPGWGILYLLFAWTGIPFVIGVIEGIMYLSMSDKAFEAKFS